MIIIIKKPVILIITNDLFTMSRVVHETWRFTCQFMCSQELVHNIMIKIKNFLVADTIRDSLRRTLIACNCLLINQFYS